MHRINISIIIAIFIELSWVALREIRKRTRARSTRRSPHSDPYDVGRIALSIQLIPDDGVVLTEFVRKIIVRPDEADELGVLSDADDVAVGRLQVMQQDSVVSMTFLAHGDSSVLRQIRSF